MAFDDSSGSVNLGSAHGSIVVSLDDAQRQIDSQIGNMERGIMSSFGRIGSRVQDMGMNMTKMFAPVTGFVVGGIAAFAKFDDVLVEIEARTGATAEQMEMVRATAIQMGQDTAFSATQASEGMLELMSSGFDLEETMSALPDVLNLAAAGMLELGFASDAVTDVLAQFSMGAEDAGMVADALAQASGSSSATIQSLIEGFANVGPIAANFGLDVRQTAAALSVFSENGIKGARAGTSLKSMLTNMASDVPKVTGMWDSLGVSMFDAEGQMRDFDDIIDDLNVAMEGMSDEERIRTIKTLGGAYGQTGLSALLAADGIDTMLDSMEDATNAQELGEARMRSFKGVVNQLKSSLETIMIQVIGPLVEDFLQPLVEEVVRLLNVFNAWLTANPHLAKALSVILGVLAVIGPVVTAFGIAISTVLSPIGLLLLGLWSLKDAFVPILEKFSFFIDDLKNFGLQEALLGIFGMGTFGETMQSSLEGLLVQLGWTRDSAIGIVENLWNTLVQIHERIVKPIGDALDILLGFYDRVMMTLKSQGIVKAIQFFFKNVGKRLKQMGKPLGNIVKDIGGSIAGKLGDIAKQLGVAFVAWIQDVVPELVSGLSDMGEAFVDWITPIIPQVLAKLGDLLMAIGTWIWSASQQLVASMFRLGAAFINWIGPIIGELLPKLGEFIGAIIEWILSDAIPMLVIAVASLAVTLVAWIVDAIPLVLPALVQFMAAIAGFIVNDLIPGVLSFGVEIGKGLLSGIANGVVNLASFLWMNVFQPGLIAIAEWFTSGQAATDLTAVGVAIIGGILDAMAASEDIVSRLWTDVLQPMLTDLAEWFTSGQAATDLTAVGVAIIGGILDAMAASEDIVSGLWTKVFQPMLVALKEWFESGQAATDIAGFVTALWDKIKEAFAFLGAEASALWTDMFLPMLIALKEWFESGQAATDIAGFVTALWDKIKEAFASVGGEVSALWTDLIKPMILSVINYFKSGKAATDFANLVKELLVVFETALADLGTWATDNIVQPIVDAIDGLLDLIQPGLDLLKTGMEDTFNGIASAVGSIVDGIVGAIEAFVNSAIGIVNGLIGNFNTLARTLGLGTIDLIAKVNFTGPEVGEIGTGRLPPGLDPDQIPGGQAGTPFTGSGPVDGFAGFVHNREAIVPAGGMSVHPGKGGVELRGLENVMSRITSNISSVFDGIDRNLINSFVGAANNAQMAMATAGGDGADGVGGNAGITINGDIILELSESVLRDPEMVERARQFGNEFRDGVITNDDIMSRLRGRS